MVVYQISRAVPYNKICMYVQKTDTGLLYHNNGHVSYQVTDNKSSCNHHIFRVQSCTVEWPNTHKLEEQTTAQANEYLDPFVDVLVAVLLEGGGR